MKMSLKDKICNITKAQSQVRFWQKEGLKVVFTNGCFDIIHPGHVLYLEEAKSLGDRLVVGVNSDDSVKRLKGKERPVQEEEARLLILSALESVDLVVLFESDTPLELINTFRPNVLVKGGDWKVDDIIGGKEVLERGGEVKSILFEEGYSTTNIIEKITSHENP